MNDWQPANNHPVPEIVRFGQLDVSGNWESQNLPAFLPLFMNGRSTLVKVGGTARETAVQVIQSVLLRLLAVVPPGTLGQHRALFYSEAEGRLEKFRIYGSVITRVEETE